MATVLFSAIRNEGPFLLEWVAYHLCIGFERIIIVANDCNDGSDALLEALDADERVTFIRQVVPAGTGAQVSAVQITKERGLLSEGDWALFLDADEFLNVKTGDRTVQSLIQLLEARGLTGMLVNWRLFGDSGHGSYPGSYFRDDFIRCENQSRRTQFKTLFRVGGIATGFSPKLHRCTLAPGTGTLSDFASGSGKPLAETERWWARKRHQCWLDEGEESFGHLVADEISYEIAQINHYIVRDPVSFALKKSRGNGAYPKEQKNWRYVDQFYEDKNRNEATDRSILYWQTEVEATKDAFLADSVIAKAQRQVERIYTKAVEAAQKATASDVEPAVVLRSFATEEINLIRKSYERASGIVEFGVSEATSIAIDLGKPCLTVAAASEPVVSAFIGQSNLKSKESRFQLVTVDVGQTGAWGYPKGLGASADFWKYPTEVWQNDAAQDADTILIGGRFRKACFAMTLASISKPVTVLFDGYFERKAYQDVGALCEPTGRAGGMAVFQIVPEMGSKIDLRVVVPWFSQPR